MFKFSFAKPENHLIHVVFPELRIGKSGIAQELLYLLAGACGFFLTVALFSLPVLLFTITTGWIELTLILVALFGASTVFALLFRLAVVSHSKLEKPLNWILPSVWLILPVPMFCLLIGWLSQRNLTVAEHAIYSTGVEYKMALVYVAIAFPAMLVNFRKHNR